MLWNLSAGSSNSLILIIADLSWIRNKTFAFLLGIKKIWRRAKLFLLFSSWNIAKLIVYILVLLRKNILFYLHFEFYSDFYFVLVLLLFFCVWIFSFLMISDWKLLFNISLSKSLSLSRSIFVDWGLAVTLFICWIDSVISMLWTLHWRAVFLMCCNFSWVKSGCKGGMCV